MKKFTFQLAVISCLLITAPGHGIAQNINVNLLGTLTYPGQTLANICGYAAGGREYALCGASNGLSIVDVTNPATPTQIVQIPGVNNLWKEIKVYRNFAYITTEGTGGGLQIVDLTNLPSATLTYHTYTGDGVIAGQLSTIHALHVDTIRKFLYLYGSNLAGGGAVVLNLSPSPYNPTYAGKYNATYIHDGYVDNDTLYGAHIYLGYFSVINFANKTSPVVLQTTQTPTAFTHNTWRSVNHKTIFTTDENSGSFLAAFDISNLANIKLLDRIQSNPGSGSIVHNTHILNDWAVTSWYRDGFTIVDAHRPQNLVQVGNYDTYPTGAGNGFDGAWGVYPYLPSGNIVVSNINEGLFVLGPTYVRACYLEGMITDSVTTLPINLGRLQIVATTAKDSSDLTGIYRAGYYLPGTYSVTFSKAGYVTKTFTNVTLTAATVTTLNAPLRPITFGINTLVPAENFLHVFPNPFSENSRINYDVTGLEGDQILEMTDVSGRLIMSYKISGSGTAQIPSSITPGTYFIRLNATGFSTRPLKLVKIQE